MTMPTVYDINGVLTILPISRNKLYQLLEMSELVGVKVGRKWLVTESALSTFLGLEAENDNHIAPVAVLESVGHVLAEEVAYGTE